MIDRLKNILSGGDLEQISAKIDEHSSLIKKQNELLAEFSKNLVDVTSELAKFKQEHLVLQEVLDSNLLKLRNFKINYNKEIADFKMLKSHIEETLADRVGNDLNERLAPHVNRIKTDSLTYNSLKEELGSVTSNLNQLKEEIARLRDVSSKIKASDFELKTFANELLKQDSHKLQLMREIDSLQKAISHERRNRR
ncbi:MAG: hypothetical protein WC471_01030 [Candidatus Woesearchaeota archaeon]